MNKRTKRLLAMMSAKPKLRTVSGLPPLIYTAKKADFLTDYRIYGQTVDGESVGDRTANLFDINSPNITKHHYYDANGIEQQNWNHDCSEYIHCKSGVTYTLSFYSKNLYYEVFINLWNSQKQFVSNLSNSGTIVDENTTLSYVFTPNQDGYITFNFLYDLGYMEDIMLNEGSTPLPYEPYGYKVPMTVEGKNLFDYDTITHGYRIQWRTGANHADETAIMSDFISVSENSTYATDTELYWLCYDANKQYIGAWNGSDFVKTGVNATNSMTAISPCKFIRILSFSRKMTPISSTTMLNCGSTALPYEPYHAPVTTNLYLPEPIKMVGDEAEYVDYGEQKQHRVRKNLLPNTATSQTINGVTFTVNSDGSVTCNGTASALSILYLVSSNYRLLNGVYKFTGCPANGSGTTFCQDLYSPSINLKRDYGEGVKFEVTANDIIAVRLIFFSGYTCNNMTFYPMIRKAAIADDTYEPYIENTDLDVTLPELPTVRGQMYCRWVQ